MLISTSKIVGKTVVVRVRRCVVGDFFFVLKSLMWGIARPRQSLQGLDNTASAYCSCFCYCYWLTHGSSNRQIRLVEPFAKGFKTVSKILLRIEFTGLKRSQEHH